MYCIGLKPLHNGPVYSATKHGLLAFARCWAVSMQQTCKVAVRKTCLDVLFARVGRVSFSRGMLDWSSDPSKNSFFGKRPCISRADHVFLVSDGSSLQPARSPHQRCLSNRGGLTHVAADSPISLRRRLRRIWRGDQERTPDVSVSTTLSVSFTQLFSRLKVSTFFESLCDFTVLSDFCTV